MSCAAAAMGGACWPALFPMFLGVFFLGCIIGAGEILSRYREGPWLAAFSLPGLSYIAINGGAAAVALYIILTAGWTFSASPELAPLWQVLIAGVSATAFFRASLFEMRVGNETVPIGPGALLKIVLVSVDRAVERRRGTDRAKKVSQIMSGVNFENAYIALPTHCFALMQNLPEKDLEEFKGTVKSLMEDLQTPAEVKASILGLGLMNLVGEDVLRAAVNNIRHYIVSGPSA